MERGCSSEVPTPAVRPQASYLTSLDLNSLLQQSRSELVFGERSAAGLATISTGEAFSIGVGAATSLMTCQSARPYSLLLPTLFL